MTNRTPRQLNDSVTRIGDALFERAQKLQQKVDGDLPLDHDYRILATGPDRYGNKSLEISAVQDGKDIEVTWNHHGSYGSNRLQSIATDPRTRASHDKDIMLGESHKEDICLVSEWEDDHAIPIGLATQLKGEAVQQNATEMLAWMRSQIVAHEIKT